MCVWRWFYLDSIFLKLFYDETYASTIISATVNDVHFLLFNSSLKHTRFGFGCETEIYSIWFSCEMQLTFEDEIQMKLNLCSSVCADDVDRRAFATRILDSSRHIFATMTGIICWVVGVARIISYKTIIILLLLQQIDVVRLTWVSASGQVVCVCV